jgi:glycosyltransferase involved in cell wall biosynthesis
VKILMLSSEFPPTVGGVGSHVRELSAALIGHGHAVEVVTLAVKGLPELSTFDGIVVRRPRLLAGMPFYDLHLAVWLRKRVAAGGVDLIHVHGLRAAAATRALGVPSVFTNHTSGFLKRLAASAWRRRRTEARIRHFNAVIAPSEELCEATRSLGYAGRIEYIPNAVDAEKFCPGDRHLRGRWGVDAETPVILLARRLVEKNGARFFAEALVRLAGRRFVAVIAGDGPEREAIERILAQGGVAGQTRILGSVPNTGMPDIYRAADISVLPSLMEATSITGLESMASALPLVGTRVGGIPDLIDEGETGLLVPPRDSQAMAKAIGDLLADADARRRMGRAGRAKVERSFTWDVIARRTLSIYEAAMQK